MFTALGRQSRGNRYDTPADLAINLSDGMWQLAPHLQIISDKIATITE
ncbi:hypothetical protein LCGC14_2772840, partial [marine sediment metagenome]